MTSGAVEACGRLDIGASQGSGHDVEDAGRVGPRYGMLRNEWGFDLGR
jgi:hypothetical protein